MRGVGRLNKEKSMYLESQYPNQSEHKSKDAQSGKCPNSKPWVIRAIAEEEKKLSDKLWECEPTAEFQYDERLRRIRFLRKLQKADPAIKAIADRLESCERNDRCCYGACPECSRLLQRWFV